MISVTFSAIYIFQFEIVFHYGSDELLAYE